MANIEKPIWSKDKQTLSNVLIRNRLETYNVTDTWYDGTPMDDTKVDDDLVYIKYEGQYLVRNMEEGQVLQKDTMDEMRNLSTLETLLLKMGIYKHVQLNGYYEKGDTPAPIDYYLSDTAEEDDGGSVIEVQSGVKLGHDFKGIINVLYFGVKPEENFDNYNSLNNIIQNKNEFRIVFPKGEYEIYEGLTIPTKKVFIIESQGRRYGGGQSALSVIKYKGGTKGYAINIEGEEESGERTRVDFKNITILNDSDEESTDGLIVSYVTMCSFEYLSVEKFYNNLTVKGYFLYNNITNCNFSKAINHGIFATDRALFNGTIIDKCRLDNNGGYGFYTDTRLGENISISNSWIEKNISGGIYLRATYTSFIKNNYFEFNEGHNIVLSSFSEFTGNHSKTTCLIENNKIRPLNDTSVVRVTQVEEDFPVIVTLESNVVENNDIEKENENSFLVSHAVNPSYIFVTLRSNILRSDDDWGSIKLIRSSGLNSFGEFSAINCNLFKELSAFKGINYFKDYVSFSNGIKSAPPLIDENNFQNTVFHLRFPEEIDNASFRIGAGTVPTGYLETRFYEGNSYKVAVDHKEGTIRVNKSVVDGGSSPDRGIYFYNKNPESELTAPRHSMCFTPAGLFYKNSGDNDTGWERAFLKAEATDNITTADATDETETQDLVNELKAKVNELLTAMKDSGQMEA